MVNLLLALGLPGAPGVLDTRRLIPFVAVTILMFSVAWLCSTIASGPALAAGCGILAWFAAFTGINYSLQKLLPIETVMQYHNILCLAGGMTFFVAGTVYYIRRFAP